METVAPIITNAIVVSAIVFAGLLTCAEILLPHSARVRVKEKTETIWLWLSYQTVDDHLKMVKKPILGPILLISTAALFFAWLYSQVFLCKTSTNNSWQCDIPISANAGIAILLGAIYISKGYAWLTRGNSRVRMLIRISALPAVLFAVLYGFVELENVIFLGTDDKVTRNVVFVYSMALNRAIMIIILSIMLASLLFVGSYALIGSYRVAGFFTLRLIESDKGIFLGAAVIFAAVASALKALFG